jgi:ribosomal protein S18 acetylase RimI-like enzyme
MNIVVRGAASDDVPALLAIGHGDNAFAVSDRIRFYEKAELEEWIASPRDNILVVADSSAGIAGFLFCKVMSSHWAMLDNFYVQPALRAQEYGDRMMQDLLNRLHDRGISYLTTLTSHDQPALARYLKRYGFQIASLYQWNELFLDR